VSRHTRRRYECIASNGYPPDVARSFQLTIQYAPELILVFVPQVNDELTSTLLFINLNQNEVRLKCRILMYPLDKISWMKDNMNLTNNHNIHQYLSTYMENYIIAELVIKKFLYEDQGEYSCIASNSLGISSKSIQLLITPTTTTTTTITTSTITEILTSQLIIPHRKRPKHSRTTTEYYHSTENLREMTISSSQGK
jgi:hypothetical protein